MLYAQAWLTVCDSRILELIAKISGEKVDVTPGSDLTERLFADAIDPDEPVVVIGGMGSIVGAVITGLAMGVIEGLTKVFYPEASSTVIFLVMVLVLLVRPVGLFGKEA